MNNRQMFAQFKNAQNFRIFLPPTLSKSKTFLRHYPIGTTLKQLWAIFHVI